jgi:hypothetical protein
MGGREVLLNIGELEEPFGFMAQSFKMPDVGPRRHVHLNSTSNAIDLTPGDMLNKRIAEYPNVIFVVAQELSEAIVFNGHPLAIDGHRQGRRFRRFRVKF